MNHGVVPKCRSRYIPISRPMTTESPSSRPTDAELSSGRRRAHARAAGSSRISSTAARPCDARVAPRNPATNRRSALARNASAAPRYHGEKASSIDERHRGDPASLRCGDERFPGCGNYLIDVVIGVRQRHEHGLELGGRQEHSRVAHAREKSPTARYRRACGLVSVTGPAQRTTSARADPVRHDGTPAACPPRQPHPAASRGAQTVIGAGTTEDLHRLQAGGIASGLPDNVPA